MLIARTGNGIAEGSDTLDCWSNSTAAMAGRPAAGACRPGADFVEGHSLVSRLRYLSDFLGGYPGFLPGVALSIVVGLASSGRLAKVLGIGRPLAWATVVSLGIVLSATLTPSPSGSDQPSRGFADEPRSPVCDLSRIGPAPMADYLSVDNTSLNVLLFVPLGAVLGMFPRSRARTALILAALVLPTVVETSQLVMVPLNRACQSGDAFDNMAGVVIGLLIGTVARWLGRKVSA
jgi:hypothetical protein